MKRRGSRIISYSVLLLLGYGLMPLWHPLVFEASYTQESLDRLSKDIETLSADKTCLETAQCRFIGYGIRSCGGYSDYLVYSTKNASYIALRYKVKAYNDIDAYLSSGVSSTCSIVPPPTLGCVENVCTVQ